MTENLKTGEKELINRTIHIGNGIILIKTHTPEGLDVQTLKVVEKKVNQETQPPIIIYDCTSADDVYPTRIFIPLQEQISEILVIQPSLIDGSDEHFRFYIEAKEESFQQ